MGVYRCTETGGGYYRYQCYVGGGYYTVGNNVIYVQFKGGYGIGDSDLEKIFQNYSIKACFSSIFQQIMPFRNP